MALKNIVTTQKANVSLGTFNELTEFMNLKFCNLGLVSEESIKNMVHDVITKNVKSHLEEPGFLVPFK